MRRVHWLAVALALTPFSSVAAAETPLPREVAAHLAKRVGDWTITGKLFNTPVVGASSVRWAPGNHCLIQTRKVRAKSDPRKASQEISLIGWDPSTGEVIEQVFAATGDLVTFHSKLRSPGMLEGELTHVRKQNRVKANFRLTERSPGHWHFQGWRGPIAATELEIVRTAAHPTAASTSHARPAGAPNGAVPRAGYAAR